MDLAGFGDADEAHASVPDDEAAELGDPSDVGKSQNGLGSEADGLVLRGDESDRGTNGQREDNRPGDDVPAG